MSKDYKSMTDEELQKIWNSDPDAWYEFYIRHRSGVMFGVASNCGNRADDNDYYGSPEEGNR